MTREISRGVRLVMVLASAGIAAAPAAAQDFNGDGFADIAIGTPGEDSFGVVDPGAVTIIYGAGPGLGLDAAAALPAVQLTQASFGLEVPEPGDNFGASLAWGDFDADGFDDLAVGSPGEDLPGGAADAGLVIVYYGSPGGLIPLHPPFLSQGPGGLPDPDEPGDHLGWSLAASDFNVDGFTDLAIGVPDEDLAFADQGLVHQIFGSPGGLMPVGAPIPIYVQPMVGDPGEAGDRFGFTLAAGDLDAVAGGDLAIGVPLEDFAGDPDCGMVNVVYSTPGMGLDPGSPTAPEVWTQDSAGIVNATQPMDHFGWALAIGNFNGDRPEDLAIGVPLENLGAAADCGAVHVIYGRGPGAGLDAFAPVPAEFWHQNIAGIPEANNPADWFGYALASGDFNGDKLGDLAIGVPLEDVGAVPDAGFVNTIYGAGAAVGLEVAAPVAPEAWHQNAPGVANANEPGDALGRSLTAGDFDRNGCADLAMGVPFEDLGAAGDCGLVITVYGNFPAGMGLDGFAPVLSEPWHQNIPGIPDLNDPADAFGSALDNDD